nr:unnamed protein product [Callosobruchus analis]
MPVYNTSRHWAVCSTKNEIHRNINRHSAERNRNAIVVATMSAICFMNLTGQSKKSFEKAAPAKL